MNINTRPIMAAAVVGVLAISSAALADSKKDYVHDEVVEKAKKKKIKEGWGASVSLGANVSFGHSSNVVGKTDGLTVAFGMDFAGALNYSKGGHEWRNSLTLTEMFSKTPHRRWGDQDRGQALPGEYLPLPLRALPLDRPLRPLRLGDVGLSW